MTESWGQDPNQPGSPDPQSPSPYSPGWEPATPAADTSEPQGIADSSWPATEPIYTPATSPDPSPAPAWPQADYAAPDQGTPYQPVADPWPQNPPVPYGAPPPAPYPPAPMAPQVAAPYGYPPENYLVWGILATVMCCVPLGIPSIVYSSQVNTKWAMGDYAGAQLSSTRAKQFAMWSAIASAVFWILYVGFAMIAATQGTRY